VPESIYTTHQLCKTNASSDYQDDGTNILLDANENAYGPGLALASDGKLSDHNLPVDIDLLGLNRYPDPHQVPLKSLLCSLRNTHTHTSKTLLPEHLFVGVGSDEAIDALIRCFCVPSKAKILTCPPTYGMYSVSAAVNDVSVVKVPLESDSVDVDVPAIKKALEADSNIKLAYLCSPGNPTGRILSKDRIVDILQWSNSPSCSWNGVVILDEAYVDFSPEGTSMAELVTEYPNLAVMQTLSKAFGLAGIRLGVAFTDPAIARMLNSMKAPYNISNPTSQIAIAALQPNNLAATRENIRKIIEQRDRLVKELPQVDGIGRFRSGGRFDANFLLVEMLNKEGKPCNQVALKVYERLASERGVVVRFRGKEQWCEGCLRITIGTEKEVDRFLSELKTVLSDARQS
jgi:histidinol-phosphate aminotransferase